MPYPALFIGLLPLFAASPAAAALVKCAGEKGGVIFQDTACPPGKELRDLEADPATVSVVPGTPVPAARARPVPGHRRRHLRRSGRFQRVRARSASGLSTPPSAGSSVSE